MKRFFLIATALCLSLLTYAQQPILLKLNPEIGIPLNVNVSMKTDVDGPQPVIMDINMLMEMLPTSKENDVFTIDNLTKSIKAELNAGLISMSYDSEEESDNELSKALGDQFSKIINKKITIQVNDRGQAVNMNLPDGFHEQGFDQSSFSNITTTLPDYPIAPGDSWDSGYEMAENPIIGKVIAESTFREETTNGYIIDLTGTVANKNLEIIGKVSGYYILDKTSCLSKESKITTTVQVEESTILSEITMHVK